MIKNSRGKITWETRTIFGRGTTSYFQVFLTAFVAFTVFSETITGIVAMKHPIRTQHSLKNSRQLSESPKESKASNDGEENIFKKSHTEMRATNRNHDNNSPALNSFLENVLRAQNELKWIDHAVRHVRIKDNRDMYDSRSSRYTDATPQGPVPMYQARIRVKRETDGDPEDDAVWDSQKKRYDYYPGPPQRVYLDEEMKFKRGVDPADFYDLNSKGNGDRYERLVYEKPAVDDSTLKDWARQEGLHLPGDWLNSDKNLKKSSDGLVDQWSSNDYDTVQKGRQKSAQIDEFSKSIDDWVDNENEDRGPRSLRGQRLAVTSNSVSRRNNEASTDLGVRDTKVEEAPTLESLKKTVIELSKSLEDNDRKIDEASSKRNFSDVKSHERHVEEMAGRKEGRAKGEHERDMTLNMVEDSDRSHRGIGGTMDRDSMRSASSWWDDPRSAADMFDFKRRDDDLEDDDEDEEGESGSELDYIMRRVKRAKDENGDGGDNSDDKTVRMYHRAGFGESYLDEGKSAELYQRRRRSEDNADESGMRNLYGNHIPKAVAYRSVVRQIREANVDSSNERLEDSSYQDAKSRRSNGNEFDHTGSNDVGIREMEASKNGVGSENEENPEKISDEGQKERKSRSTSMKMGKDEVIATEKAETENREAKSDNDKRSTSSKANRENRKQPLPADEIPGDKSVANSKLKLDESLKTAPMEPPAEAAAHLNLDGPTEHKEDDGKDRKLTNVIGHVEWNPSKKDTEQRSSKKEVEKSEPMDDDVHKKLSNEPHDEKKEDEQDQKNVWHEPDNGEKLAQPSDRYAVKADKRSSQDKKLLPPPHAAKPEEIVTKAYKMEAIRENEKPDEDTIKLILEKVMVKEQAGKLESPKITEDSHTKEESNEEDQMKTREVSNLQKQRESKLVSNHEKTQPLYNSELKNPVDQGESETKLKDAGVEKLKEPEVKNDKLTETHPKDNAKLHGREEPSPVKEKDPVALKSDNGPSAKLEDDSKHAEGSNKDEPENLRPPSWYLDLKQSLQDGHKEPAWYRELTHNVADKDVNLNGRRDEDKKDEEQKYGDEGKLRIHAGPSFREDKKMEGDVMSNPRYYDDHRRNMDIHEDETRDRSPYNDKRQSSDLYNEKPAVKEALLGNGDEKNTLRKEHKPVDYERRLKYEDNDNYEDDKRLIKYSDKENQKYHSSSLSNDHEGGILNSEMNGVDEDRNSRLITDSGFKETDQNANGRIRRDVRSDEMKRKLLWAPEADELAVNDDAKEERNRKDGAKIEKRLANVVNNMKDSQSDEAKMNIIGGKNEKLEDSDKRCGKGDPKLTPLEQLAQDSVKDNNIAKNENANEKLKSVKRSIANINNSNGKISGTERRKTMIEREVTGNLINPSTRRRSLKKDVNGGSNSEDLEDSDPASSFKTAKLQKRLSATYDNNENSGDTAEIAMAYEPKNAEDSPGKEDTSPDFLEKRSLIYEKEPGNGEESYDSEDDELKDFYQDAEDNEDDLEDLGDELSGDENEAARPIRREVVRDHLKDKVNMLIRQKIDGKSKMKQSHKRSRRRPVAAVEYYDYDNDDGGNDQDSRAIDDDQHPSLSAAEEEDVKKEGDRSKDSAPQCDKGNKLPTKKDEHLEEEIKEDKENSKLKNHHPKQEFIADVEMGKAHKKKHATTQKTTTAAFSCGKVKFSVENRRLNDRTRKVYQDEAKELRGRTPEDFAVHWLGQPQEADNPEASARVRHDRLSKDHEKTIEHEGNQVLAEPPEYNVDVHRQMEPETVGVFLGYGPPGERLDGEREIGPSRNPYEAYERNGNRYRYNEEAAEEPQSNIRPMYEEVDKVNEWKGSEIRERPRLRGDQRMYHESRDDPEFGRGRDEGRRNWYPRDRDRIEDLVSIGRGEAEDDYGDHVVKGRRFLKEAKGYNALISEPIRDSLLDRSGPADTVTGERTYLVISNVRSENPANPNPDSTSSSGSNYLALKITDDMFKGGIEQSNPTEEKPQDLMMPSHTTTEWKVIKVVDTKLSPLVFGRGITGQQRKEEIVQSDSHSPYETRKNFEAPVPEEGNEELNHDKQAALSSKDIMHESFVDTLNWGEDLDADSSIRFGRGLKSVQSPAIRYPDLSRFNDLSSAVRLRSYSIIRRNVSRGQEQRIGRHLQSVSFPTEPYDRIRARRDTDDMDWEAEEPPAQKYLRNTQGGYGEEKVVKHWVVKKSLAEEQDLPSNDDKLVRKDGIKRSSSTEIEEAIKADKERDMNINRRLLNKEQWDGREDAEKANSTTETLKEDQRAMNKRNVADPGNNDGDIETNKIIKRSLTNVEEWEMNTPIVQKQHIVSANEQRKDNIPDGKENISDLADISSESKTGKGTSVNEANKFQTNSAPTKSNERYVRDDGEQSIGENDKPSRVTKTIDEDREANKKMKMELQVQNLEPELRPNVIQTEEPQFHSENVEELQRTRRNAKSYIKYHNVAPKQERSDEYPPSWSSNTGGIYESGRLEDRRSPRSSWNSNSRTNKDHSIIHRSPNHSWHLGKTKESSDSNDFRQSSSTWKDNRDSNNWQGDSEGHGSHEKYHKSVRSAPSNKKTKDENRKEKRQHYSKDEKEETANETEEKSPDAHAFSTRRHHRHQSSLKSTSSQVVHSGNASPKSVKEHGSRTSSKDRFVSPLIGKFGGSNENVEGGSSNAQSCPRAMETGVGEKKVLDESPSEQSTMKPQPEENAKKKFTVLLAADNMEDESQMDLALHGELAGKIVERIFEQVQRNEALKVALGPGLYRKHKPGDAVLSDKIYRQGLDEDEVKHTEAMMRRVMELLGRLILDEVQRKTCASLPPDMRDFLQWMLGVEQDEGPSDQVPPLPLVHNKEQPHRSDDKFLFEDPSQHSNVDVDELYKKVRLLRSLINEYNSLTTKEKTRVQTVHDYLVRQLALLVKYIEAKEEEEARKKENCGAHGGESILQYQNVMHGVNDSANITPMPSLSPLVNTPSILRLSNSSFSSGTGGGSSYAAHSKRREVRSSNRERRRHHHKKHKHRKHRKHRKHKKNKNENLQSPEYRKLIRRVANMRHKRANLYDDQWDPFDTGYEEPTIYSSSGKLTKGSSKRKRAYWDKPAAIFGDKTKENEYENRRNNPYFWADVLSGKLDSDDEFGSKENTYEDRKELAAKIKEPRYHENYLNNENGGFDERSPRGAKLKSESFSNEYGLNSKAKGDNENGSDSGHERVNDAEDNVGDLSNDSLWNTPDQEQTQMETDFDLKPAANENPAFNFETLDKNEESELDFPGQRNSEMYTDYSKKKREVVGSEEDRRLVESSPGVKLKSLAARIDTHEKLVGSPEDVKEDEPFQDGSDTLKMYAAQNGNDVDLYSSLRNPSLTIPDAYGKSSQKKRDVLSASIALQPWLNPQKDDMVSSEFLKELSDQLIHTPNKLSAGIKTDESLESTGQKADALNDLQRKSLPLRANLKPSHEDADTRGSAPAIKDRSIADDEVMLLNKREAWKNTNEQQLEEVAFGKDMRGRWKEKEQFEKLTEMDKKKVADESVSRKKREDDDEKLKASLIESRGQRDDKSNVAEEKELRKDSVSNENVTNGSTMGAKETKDASPTINGPTKSDAKATDERVIKEVEIFEILPLAAGHEGKLEDKINVYADNDVSPKRKADQKTDDDRKLYEDQYKDKQSVSHEDEFDGRKIQPPDNDEKIHERYNKKQVPKGFSESSEIGDSNEQELNPASGNEERKRDASLVVGTEKRDAPKVNSRLQEAPENGDAFKRDVRTDHWVKEYEQRRLDNLGKPMENLVEGERRKDKRSLDRKQFQDTEEYGWRARDEGDDVVDSKIAKMKPDQDMASYENGKSRNKDRAFSGNNHDNYRAAREMRHDQVQNEDKRLTDRGQEDNYELYRSSRDSPSTRTISDDHNVNLIDVKRGKLSNDNDYSVNNPSSYEGSDFRQEGDQDHEHRSNIKHFDKGKEESDGELVQKNILEGNLNAVENGRQLGNDMEPEGRTVDRKERDSKMVQDFVDAGGNQEIELKKALRRRREDGTEQRLQDPFLTANVHQGDENSDIAKMQSRRIVKRMDSTKPDKPIDRRSIDLLPKDKIRARSGLSKDSVAILPLLEVSEQRQMQNQAARTQKDDQRDISDQMLGFESPLIVSLNTF